MIRGVESLDVIKQIAYDTRHDFERGGMSETEIIDATIARGTVWNVAKREWAWDPDRRRWAREKIDGFREVRVGPTTHYFKVPLVNLDPPAKKVFPEGHCVITTSVLAERIMRAGVLDREVEIIMGSYGEGNYTRDPHVYSDNPHTVAGIGQTPLGQDTFVDIMPDQFDGIDTPVYVGSL